VQAVAISFTFNNLKQQMTDEQIAKSWDQVLKNAKELGLKVR
jgi:phenylalanyl-tRNA synthetase beta subunit